jgi:competence protein ComFC
MMGIKTADILEPVLSLLFPNRCVFCGDILEGSCCICDECVLKIELINTPFCQRCGAPLYNQTMKSGVCRQCQDLEFQFHRNESLGVFAGILRDLIHLYKFNKRRSLNRTFTALVLRNKREYIENHDLLMPVPLTALRHSERGFNQSSLIAEGISKIVQMPCLRDCLKRTGASKPQSSIGSIRERINNLTDRFQVREKYRESLMGKNILIIDDVLTTGATSSACARALYDEGAGRVRVLTLARAVKE